MTRRQKAFSVGLARGLNATEAARLAGYSDASPGALRQTASRNFSLPEIQRAAHAERERRICGGLAQKALACLESTLDNPEAPAAARVQAARWVLEAGGHGLESRKLASRLAEVDERAVSQLTAADLERLVAKTEALVHARRGEAIDAEIIAPSDDCQTGGHDDY